MFLSECFQLSVDLFLRSLSDKIEELIFENKNIAKRNEILQETRMYLSALENVIKGPFKKYIEVFRIEDSKLELSILRALSKVAIGKKSF